MALRPWTMLAGATPSRSAKAERNPDTLAFALRSPSVIVPTLESGPVIVRAIASPTAAGVWVPPGPSK